MNRQLVGGRQQQQQQRWAFLSWLNLFPPSFALLNSHLLFSLSLSFFSSLSLSLSAVVDPPHAEPPTHTHTHTTHTHTLSLLPPHCLFSLSLSLFPSPQWLYPRVQMDTMKASSQPLSYPWPCRFYSSLIQQLLSSMAIVKETAHHQCALQHPIFSLLLFPSLSPMWHKGLSYTPPLLGLCQEPSSVRLLLYCMREIHLALRTRWSVKKKKKTRAHSFSGGAPSVLETRLRRLFRVLCRISGGSDRATRIRGKWFAFNHTRRAEFSSRRELLVWCWQIFSDLMFCESKNPLSKFRDVLNLLAEFPLDVGSQHF